MYDVVIVGGGPAGLSAATWLGRACRTVLVVDAGYPRNAASHAVHGMLGLDGIPPKLLRRRARGEARDYGVEIRDVAVVDGRAIEGGFEVDLADGRTERCRKLLLATGLLDELPEVEGLRDLYGRSVFHCPYCDGWEFRDQPLGVLGRGRGGLEYARVIRSWSADVVLFADGSANTALRHAAAEIGITVENGRVRRLEGADGHLERVVLANGKAVPRRALFFKTGRVQRSPLPEALGCRFDRAGSVLTNKLQSPGVDGLYVAGDAVRDVKFAVVAAAEGARAAYAINSALVAEGRLRGAE